MAHCASAAAPIPVTGTEGTLKLGRWRLRAQLSSRQLRDDLSLIFKQCWSDALIGDKRDGLFRFFEARDGERWPAGSDDALTVHQTAGGISLTSEFVRARLERGEPLTIEVLVRRAPSPAAAYQVHLAIAMHRLLLAMDAVYLPAAAVVLDGHAHVFIGEKGAGKSTISLALGLSGATVLSDDHVLIERTPAGFVVSGCESLARVTADTEAQLFGEPLPVAAQDFAGTLKKEFALADYVQADLSTARPIAALHFPRVGTSLQLTPRRAQHTVLDLIERTRRSYRPQNAEEIAQLLDFWSALATAVPSFDLELSTDLQTLARLPSLLRA
ncbi:MAG: hypothetical protein ABL961_12605 [Vicinamibacterales bacterium]